MVGRTARGYLQPLAAVALATLASELVGEFVDLPDVVMLYVLGILLVAMRSGRGPSLLASALSVAAFDFFFVPPIYTFTVRDHRHLIMFATLFVVGVVVSSLTTRLRGREAAAAAREHRTTALYTLVRDLGGRLDAAEVAAIAGRRIGEVLGTSARVELGGGAGGGPSGELPLPLEGARGALGVVVLSGERARSLDPDTREFVDALVRQCALAIERAQLASEAQEAALRARTEELRSSLLSAVSHDLRTPLACITGAATTLLDSRAPESAAARRELLESIAHEADRMARMVANLLDMVRLEAGGLEPRRAWVPLEEVVGAALVRLERTLEGHPGRVALPADLPLVAIDPVLFEHVLGNLVENACKYTPEGSAIDVEASADSEQIAIDVLDRGPGIPSGHGERVFEKFQRGHHPGVGGAGLGLAICRGIVRAHGGELGVSARPGGGARFQIRLPRPDGEPAALPLEEAS